MITIQAIEKNLKKYDADFKTATTIQLYNAVSSAVMDDIAEKWADNRKHCRCTGDSLSTFKMHIKWKVMS